MALTPGIIFALLSMFFWGVQKIIGKKAVDRIGPYFTLVYQQMFVSVSLIIAAFFFGDFSLPAPKMLLTILLVTAIGFFGVYYMFRSMEFGKLSIVLPISHSFVILTVLLSYIFYNERPNLLQIAAISLIIIGILLLSFKYSEIRKIRLKNLSKNLAKGVGFAFINLVCWGFYFFFIKQIVVAFEPIAATAYLETGVLFYCLVILAFKAFQKKVILPDRRSWLYCFVSGLGVAIGSLFLNLGLRTEAVSIVMPISSASLFVAVVTAAIVLKEKIESNQKIAIALIILGLIMISL